MQATPITLVSMCMLPGTAIMVASEAIAASKWPWRSLLTSNLNSVASTTHVPVLLWPLYCWKSLLFPGEEGQKCPPRLPVASKVTSDLKFELSGLNNLCSSTFLASIVLYSKSRRRRKQNEHVDLPAHTSPHKHSVTVGLELSSLE